jgi:hypothetical protein
MSHTVSYRNWQFYVNLNAIRGGGASSYYMASNSTYNLTAFGNNQQQNWLNETYWTPETPSNTFTRPNYSNPYGYTYPKDRSFIRVQDVSLQYAFDQKQLARLRMSGLRFYVSAKNPFLFTDWLGMDPENGGALGRANPLFRTINLGTNLSF